MTKSLILLVALLSVGIAHAEGTAALQEKCSKAADDLFGPPGYKTSDQTQQLGQCFWSHESHYNIRLDRCFILISGSCFKAEESYRTASLVDVSESREYASYTCSYDQKGTLLYRFCSLGDMQMNMVNGHEFNRRTKRWDIISDAYLNSLQNPFSDLVRNKFDDWVKPYMEE